MPAIVIFTTVLGVCHCLRGSPAPEGLVGLVPGIPGRDANVLKGSTAHRRKHTSVMRSPAPNADQV